MKDANTREEAFRQVLVEHLDKMKWMMFLAAVGILIIAVVLTAQLLIVLAHM